jgi:hypothetical protein
MVTEHSSGCSAHKDLVNALGSNISMVDQWAKSIVVKDTGMEDIGEISKGGAMKSKTLTGILF